MYSRNYTTGQVTSAIKLNPNVRAETSGKQNDTIPVRRFTDNFAYERFNRMGSSDKKTDISSNTERTTEASTKTNISDNMVSESSEHPSQTEIQENDNTCNDITLINNNILSRFKLIFDADTLLIILAVVMLFFSDNATNDKLTPLALLAILFL